MRRLVLSGALVAATFTPGYQLVAGSLSNDASNLPVLQRFFQTDDSSPTDYRARRHLEARTDHFHRDAWMDVATVATSSTFDYTIIDEGGSDYIRSHVFKAALDTERKMWASGDPDRSAIRPDNYTFEDRGAEASGLAQVGVRPKRKEVLLVDGSIFLRPDDGELVRVQGALSKNPSFWTRHVEVVGHYERINGVRLPVAFESYASVFIAGKSTFTMTYDYDVVNGQPVTAK